MNFLQIHDDTFIDTQSIKAIYREGNVLMVDVDSYEDHIVGAAFESTVLAFAQEHAYKLVRSTFGNGQ